MDDARLSRGKFKGLSLAPGAQVPLRKRVLIIWLCHWDIRVLKDVGSPHCPRTYAEKEREIKWLKAFWGYVIIILRLKGLTPVNNLRLEGLTSLKSFWGLKVSHLRMHVEPWRSHSYKIIFRLEDLTPIIIMRLKCLVLIKVDEAWNFRTYKNFLKNILHQKQTFEVIQRSSNDA